MPPKFPFQTLLEIRHSKVESLEIALGELMQNHHKMEEYLDLLNEEKAGLNQQLKAKLQGDIDLFAIEQIRGNIKAHDVRIEQVKTLIAQLAAQIEIKRQEVVAARQDEEVLDTLKTHQLEAFMVEQNLAEGRAQDDIYIAQAFRNRQSVA